MGGAGNSENGNSNTVMDTLLKFITMDKLGVSLDNSSNNPKKVETPDDDQKLEEYKVIELEEKKPQVEVLEEKAEKDKTR